MKVEIKNIGNIFFKEGNLEKNDNDIDATETKPIIVYPFSKDIVKEERRGKKSKNT